MENVCGLKLSCPCWSFHWLITECHFASWSSTILYIYKIQCWIFPLTWALMGRHFYPKWLKGHSGCFPMPIWFFNCFLRKQSLGMDLKSCVKSSNLKTRHCIVSSFCVCVCVNSPYSAFKVVYLNILEVKRKQHSPG